MNPIELANNATSAVDSRVAGSERLSRAQMFPLKLVVEVPVVGFTVRSLLELRPGSIVETLSQHNEDLTVHANGQLIGTAKFDVTGDLLAVRITEVL